LYSCEIIFQYCFCVFIHSHYHFWVVPSSVLGDEVINQRRRKHFAQRVSRRKYTCSFPCHRYNFDPRLRYLRVFPLVTQLWFPGLGTPVVGQYSLSAVASHRCRGDSIKSIPWKMHHGRAADDAFVSLSSTRVRAIEPSHMERNHRSASFHLLPSLCQLDCRAAPSSLSMIVRRRMNFHLNDRVMFAPRHVHWIRFRRTGKRDDVASESRFFHAKHRGKGGRHGNERGFH